VLCASGDGGDDGHDENPPSVADVVCFHSVGAAIFFEFKHYKPKKRFTSTKCFAFMEMDEIKAGPIVIELYKKPTDFKRKKLQLLTKKPLYLHLHQTLHKE